MIDPSIRNVVGMFALLALIAIWAVIVASFSPLIGGLPILVQAPIYILAGIIWVLPARPLMRWVVTGRWR
ncbi:DUF2842 domain-containing protein [Sphingomonas changnyeongensis]|nr:DUF2842 domain-containing protein [Sphingomonas changnyeongensis]